MATKPESRLQRRIQKDLKSTVGGWWFKVHGGPFQPAGIPDLVGCVAGFFVAIEVKMPDTGRISRIQRYTIKQIKEAGGIAFVATSSEEATKLLLYHIHSKLRKNSSFYKTWQNMKSRCYNEKTPYYKNYGGKGIRVCDEWLKGAFYFWLDMGYPPDIGIKYSIDRIDPDGNYCPENCRWLPHDQNSARSLIEIDGEQNTMIGWARHFDISIKTVRNRISWGWELERALTTPPDKKFHP